MSLSTGGYGVRAPDAAGTSSFAEQACPGAGPQVGTELAPAPRAARRQGEQATSYRSTRQLVSRKDGVL